MRGLNLEKLLLNVDNLLSLTIPKNYKERNTAINTL
jgi:hypothetical protein